jgi:GntR family transcriptional regulator
MTTRVETAGARELDRRGTAPLWTQLLADLRRRLGAGEFTAAFPGELALVAEYRVSRYTVREALRRLREEGLVVAERGRPPRLASPTEIAQPLGSPYSLFQSVEATGRVQRNVVRTLDVRADGIVAARLGLEEREDVAALAAPVLRHRLLLSFVADAEGRTSDDAIAALLGAVSY